MKAMPINDTDGECQGHLVECPACGHGHFFNNEHGSKQHPKGASWSFNGDTENPTFTPSMLVLNPGARCHSFVTNGKIKYLSDCDHAMAGQTVDLPDIE